MTISESRAASSVTGSDAACVCVPVIERLTRRAEFLRVAASGLKAVTPGLVLQAAPARGDRRSGAIGLGFTVSRKVGNSVARNRARRRLREIARAILPDHGRPGMDYVIIGRGDAVTRPFDKLCLDLERALARVGSGKRS